MTELGVLRDYASRHRSPLFPGNCGRDEDGGRRSSGSSQNGRDHAAPWPEARFSSGIAEVGLTNRQRDPSVGLSATLPELTPQGFRLYADTVVDRR